MDYLASVLRYKFWICFVGAILLPSVGWFLATGAMEQEVDKRWKLVDKNFNSNVLKESTVSKIPNEKYIEGIKQINATINQDLQTARSTLQTTQRQYMTWPAEVSEAMAGAGYRKPPTDPDALFKYGNVYRQELEQVRQIVHPYDELKKKGIVYAPEGILPKAQDDSWAVMGPPVERMWDAQEDIWLLKSIMQAIAAVNKDATSIIDAPIKAIQEVSLRGGSKVNPAAPAPGAPGAPTAARNQYAGPVNTGSVSFNPADEFGPEVSLAPASKAVEPAESEDEDGGTARKRSKRKADRQASKNNTGPSSVTMVSRYITGSNAEPQKTRGFYLQVAMDHTFVPELVSQLSNMPWPTEIARVQQSDEVTRITIRGRVEGGVSPTAPAASSSGGGFGSGASASPGGLVGPLSFSHADAPSEPADSTANQIESSKSLVVGPNKNKTHATGVMEKDLVSAALDDPYVGLVVIAGTMTIYNQPADPPAKPQDAQAQAQPTPPAAQSEDDEQPEEGEAKPAPAKAESKPATPAPTAAAPTAAAPNPAPNAASPANQQPKPDNPQAKAPAPPNPGGKAAAPTPAKPPDPAGKK